MRKFYTTIEYKRWNTKQAEKSWKKNLVSDEKKTAKRRGHQGLKKKQIRERLEEEKYVKKKAPSNFSFVENTEEILDFLNDLKALFSQRKDVLIDLQLVTNMTNDAIVLLISFINNPAIVKGVRIFGNYPRDPRLRAIFMDSGVFSKDANVIDDKQKNYILTRKNKKAEGGIASDVIRRATKVVFGEEGRCPGIYRSLMESMANTCYHAKPSQIAKETWWLTVYHDKQKNHVAFAFIDLGVGIFKSSKMNDLKAIVVDLFGLADNKEILKEIILGHKGSRTKIPYRGKGLPTIYMGLERNYYSNLHIISNNVKADLSKGEYTELKTEFNGTFLYWELNNTNRWIR